MFAGRNRPAGKANDLVVAPHRLTRDDGAAGNLVTGRDQTTGRHALDCGTAHQLAAGYEDIVRRVESDKRVHVSPSWGFQ